MIDAPRKRLRFRFQALKGFVDATNPKSIYIDGVGAQITILRNPQGQAFSFDGVGNDSFTTDVSDGSTPIVINFPMVRDEEGRLIRYDQRLRVIGGTLDEIAGFVLIFYEGDELPGSTL